MQGVGRPEEKGLSFKLYFQAVVGGGGSSLLNQEVIKALNYNLLHTALLLECHGTSELLLSYK